ncbi:purine-nucleoside phosphorylase [Imperialibacter roseus]|uniref:Purine nucleoside phosphorylase n=1 Tax=Imperialibacter roseus TaxID=1324217 RepID=A0ABZ0IIN0_9BACT|nr:purine-nucleoside phosphorylase [Imperialibacter roseus]WOK04892.1 purine-nucleoside phosphorylase [Imperialibacter roseus]
MHVPITQIQEISQFLQSKTAVRPETGIILGTGLHSLVDEVTIADVIDYKDIPHFPVSTVEFHKGKLIFGHIGQVPVVVMQGRFHFYEGYSMQQVTLPVRVMKLLGIKRLFVSNASGGLNPDFQNSDMMMVTDHINLFTENPLRGKNLDTLGDRFPDMSEAYDRGMLKLARQIAKEEGIDLKEGVYAGVEGPNLETPAEYKYLRIIGADAVGMSTVPEVIVARHMEIPVFALSIITDMGVPGLIKKVNLQEIVDAAQKAEPLLKKMVSRMVESTGD